MWVNRRKQGCRVRHLGCESPQGSASLGSLNIWELEYHAEGQRWEAGKVARSYPRVYLASSFLGIFCHLKIVPSPLPSLTSTLFSGHLVPIHEPTWVSILIHSVLLSEFKHWICHFLTV